MARAALTASGGKYLATSSRQRSISGGKLVGIFASTFGVKGSFKLVAVELGVLEADGADGALGAAGALDLFLRISSASPEEEARSLICLAAISPSTRTSSS